MSGKDVHEKQKEELIANSTPLLDPAQVEADMIAEEQRKANDPSEQAAMLFKAYTNGFKQSIKGLPKKSVQRVLEALVMSPLVKVTLINDAERIAYQYGDSMIQAKLVMQLGVYKESFDSMVETGNDGVETTYEFPKENNDELSTKTE